MCVTCNGERWSSSVRRIAVECRAHSKTETYREAQSAPPSPASETPLKPPSDFWSKGSKKRGRSWGCQPHIRLSGVNHPLLGATLTHWRQATAHIFFVVPRFLSHLNWTIKVFLHEWDRCWIKWPTEYESVCVWELSWSASPAARLSRSATRLPTPGCSCSELRGL